jgi:hypothetical protein
MTCRKVLKLLPLLAGDDLGPRQARAVRAHVDACPACRRELNGIREALARVKAAARAESLPDWSEGEWTALMVRATGGAAGPAEELGGVKGSHPIDGGYHPWQCPNWAAKFFADALMLEAAGGAGAEGPGPVGFRNDG